MTPRPAAHLGGLRATGLREVRHDVEAVERGGRWAVLLPYEGTPTFARFDTWTPASAGSIAGPWSGPRHWRSSVDSVEYEDAVASIRQAIGEGRVYQANLCRILEADLPDPEAMDIAGLHAVLQDRHPAPFSGMLRLPDQGVHVATASPELFLRRRGTVVESSPIKGTASSLDRMLDKDRAENVMIVDLVRNDLSRVCRAGTVEVAELLAPQEHPGLVHLVSTVRGLLRSDAGWAEVLAATFPPGSVTGAPKFTALQVIDELEPVPRGPYCGAIGWIDADAGEAELAVAIRTFWRTRQDGRHVLRFGTGAGITWGSDPRIEWEETELKASRLIDIASGSWPQAAGPAGTDCAGGRSRLSEIAP